MKLQNSEKIDEAMGICQYHLDNELKGPGKDRKRNVCELRRKFRRYIQRLKEEKERQTKNAY